MKIALVIPPSAFLLDDRAFPFLGPLQIGAVARERGHEVTVLDLTGYKRRHPDVVHADPAEVRREAEERMAVEMPAGVDFVGFYSLAAQHPFVMDLFRFARGRWPEASFAIGGPHASTAPESCVRDGFDHVVVSDQGGGGGEPGFLEAVARVERRGKRRRSLVVDDRIVKVASRKGVRWESDEWPLPARDLVDLDSYRYFLGTERCTSVVSATGCPFACTFCSHWEGYRKLEAKSSARVAEEIRSIRDVYGWRAIMFYDDEINLRPDFYDEFLPMLAREGVVWRAFFKNGRNLTTESVFERMAAAGCVQICTGAESADPSILRAIKKGATVEDNTKFVEYAVKYGIHPKVFTQVGLPGETPDTIRALRDWLVEMAKRGLSDADTSITTPYEGTPIFDHPEKHDIRFDKAELDFSSKVVLYKGIPNEYKSYVSHENLTRDDLVVARQWVEDEFRKAAGLKPLLFGKDDG